MTPQERDVIAGIFDRLKHVANAPRDPEAEKFIAQQLQQQPHAPYAMAQSIFAQEQAVTALVQQVEQLQAQVQQLQQQTQQAPQGGGFLSSLFGGGRPQPAAQPQPGRAPFQRGPVPGMPMQGGMQPGMPHAGMQQAGPWGQQPQRQGMGFMGTAMATAAGVAGGMMAANALSGLFAGGADQTAAAGQGLLGDTASEQPASAEAPAYEDPGMMHEASYDDPGADFGGGDDWA